MKETKNTTIQIRLTPTEKEAIREYAEKHQMTMSEAILTLCQRIFIKEEN